ncbi:MAG: hypothetical protein ACUVXG_01610 [Anaerolineae bacterium]
MQFGGLLANPLDGNSYLAKMRIGTEGGVRYYLIYSPEPQVGHYFYIPYLLWGYVTARLGIPLILAYHLGRVLAAFFFLWSAFRFLGRFSLSSDHQRVAWALVAVSSGLGWLLLPLGRIAPDLWVPEAISFYALFTNVHFPLATGLLLWLFLLCAEPPEAHSFPRRAFLAVGCALGLALALPFAVMVAYPVIGGALAWSWARQKTFPAASVLVTSVSAVPVAIVGAYDLYVAATDPLIRSWTLQDINPSPAPWEVLVTYGLVAFLAFWGAWRVLRTGERRLEPLVVWVAIQLLVIYAPTALQRRLIMGLHVPLCGLAGLGLLDLARRLRDPSRRRLLVVLTVSMSAISNLVVILIALSGAVAHDRHYYFTQAEAEAMRWLHDHAAARSVVLAAPSTSLFVPVWSGLQVVYGHPLETAFAVERKRQVERFFAGGMTVAEEQEWLSENRVQYLLWGPAEDEIALFAPESKPYLSLILHQGDVTLFRVEASPASHAPTRTQEAK